jgi:hypothetical protein
MRKFVKGLLATVLVATAVMAAPRVVNAWGESEYTGNGQPQFNTYTNVPNFGDEHDFLRVGANGTDTHNFTNNFNFCEGEARLSVYIHNGAPDGYNGTNNTGTGVAKDTKLAVNIQNPKALKAIVSASNAATVTDGAGLTCNGEDVQLEFVPNSATLYSINRGESPLTGDAIVNGGVAIGSYANNGVMPGCWDFRVYVSLVVKVKKVPTKPATPVYSCDLFDIKSDKRTVTVTRFEKTAKDGATLRDVVVNWDDGNTTPPTTNPVGQSHTYAKDGPYTIKAVATFKVNNKDVVAPTNGCVKQVSFTSGVPTPPKPTAPAVPTTMPVTGPGNVAAVFAATSVAGAVAYRVFMARRLARQV